MTAEKLEWVEFNDFKPGIAQRPGTRYPPGTAVDDDTYGCVASPSGALIPGPSLTDTISYTPPSVSPTDLESKFWITGLAVFGPVTRANSGNTGGEDQSNAELWFGFEWFYNDGGLKEDKRIARYLRAYQNPVWEDITDSTITGITDPGGVMQPRPCVFGYTTANPDDTDEVGVPVVAFCFNEILGYFPSHDTPDQPSVEDIPKPDYPDFPQPWRLICHQGRVVVFPLNVYHHGGNNALVPNGEGFYWTKVNDPTSLAPETATDSADWMGYFDGRFQSEQPTGWRSVASLTANELLLFKGKGGATLIRGDLDDPTVIRLPNVTDVGFARCQGTNSQIGYVYAADADGVWAWSGSDGSQSLSPQMDDMFWRPISDEPYYSTESSMATWREWVVVPNGWMFDTDLGGWWRYHDPDLPALARHDTDWTSRWMYAAPLDFTHSDSVVAYEFDRRTPRNHFSWKSHPFSGVMNRNVQAREIVVVASGKGTVKASIVSRDGQLSTREFRFDDDFPDAVRKDVAVTGPNLQLKLESEGDSDEPAPTIYEVRVGLQPRMRIDRGVA